VSAYAWGGAPPLVRPPRPGLSSAVATPPDRPPFTHLLADFLGVPAAQLRDGSLVGGLLVAAAGAAGLTAHGSPVMRTLPHDGVAGLFLLEGCHIAVHTFPSEELLLLDVLARATQDAQKAVDVFARRLTTRAIHAESRARG
jgi:S-adenosylmethionine/arginine decarboxylase-like enzyme